MLKNLSLDFAAKKVIRFQFSSQLIADSMYMICQALEPSQKMF